MPIFAYAAIDVAGRRVRGRLEASNDSDLEQRLACMQLAMVWCSETRKTIYAGLWSRPRITRRELVLLCFHLEHLTRAGVPLIDGLADFRDGECSPALRALASTLMADIASGLLLSAAMARHQHVFDAIFVNLVAAGEASGRMPEVFAKLAEMLKWHDELAAQSRKILLYPAFVAAVVGAVVIFLMVYLVPQLLTFIRGLNQQLPLHTRLLLACSSFLRLHAFTSAVVLMLAVGGMAGLLRSHAQFRHLFDGWKLKVWIVGPILRAIILTRFTYFLGMLYDSGIPLIQALKLAEGVMGNTVLAADIARAHEAINAGQGLAASLQRVNLFPALGIRILRAGEASGALDKSLNTLSYFYARDVQEAVARIQTMIEPLLTLVLGGILAWVMLAVLGPIYDVIARIQP